MKPKLLSNKDYVAGWLDTSIHDFLEMLPPNQADTRYSLITCLDSDPDPASLRTKSRHLRTVASNTRVLATGLLLPTKLLLEADSHSQIFFGFDEAWFFPSDEIAPKPDSARLVGPSRIDRLSFNKLCKWMSRNSCSLGLGDGEGLNFIVKAQGLVRYVLGHSLEQPQPGMVPLQTRPKTVLAR